MANTVNFEIFNHPELVKGEIKKTPWNDLFSDTRTHCYIIMFSGKKGAEHFIDGQLVRIPPYSVLFVGPDRCSRFSPEPFESTHILVFSSLFYNRTPRDAHSLTNNPLFNNFGPVYILTPPDESVIYCKTLAYLLHTAKKDFQNTWGQDLAHNIIEQILIMGSIYANKTEHHAFESNKEQELVLEFQKTIAEYFRQEVTVRFYAEYLNVTERQLSNATKKNLGLTAKDVITNHIMEEARWQLAHRSESIKEIGLGLGFSEEHNFSAFFKKNQKLSPMQFRRKIQQPTPTDQ